MKRMRFFEFRKVGRLTSWVGSMKAGWAVLVIMGLFCVFWQLQAADAEAAFDQANKLYEEGKFTEAAAAYEKLIQAGRASATLYYNLGNAWYKAGQNGRAIAAYWQAQRLTPRDPNVRFNLEFVRKKVTGFESSLPPAWQRGLTALTVNEWTLLAVVGYWLWFVLLALREIHPALKKPLRGYTAAAGIAAVLLAGCLGGAAYEESRRTEAVVVIPNAVVRLGPLEESHVFYQAPDGSELVVLGEKIVTVGGRNQSWLQVQDAHRRSGWVQREQVIVLGHPVAAE